MSNPNLAKEGEKYQFKERPKNSGRKPSQLKKYLKETNITMDDVVRIFKSIMFTYDYNEIKRMATQGKDADGKYLPAAIWGFCLAFIEDCRKGWSGNGFFNQFMNRAFGKEAVDLNINDKRNDPAKMSRADREAYFTNLMQAAVNNPDILKLIQGAIKNDSKPTDEGKDNQAIQPTRSDPGEVPGGGQPPA